MKEKEENFDSLLQLRKKYYQEIGYSLSVMDAENFIAYSQHHGLPTELLDVTRNALIALYFACDEYKEGGLSCDGFVYSLDDKRVVDFEKQIITKNIENQNMNFNNKVLNMLFDWGDGGDDLEFLSEFLKFIDDTQSLFDYIKKSNMCTKEFLFDFLKKYNTYLNDYDLGLDQTAPYEHMEMVYQVAHQFIDIIIDEYEKKENNSIEEIKKAIRGIEVGEYSKGINTLLTFKLENNLTGDDVLNFILSMIAFEIYKNDTSQDFPPIKYWVHKPSVIFDRMRNQQGNFIYQNHVIFDSNMYIQKFESKQTFKIPAENKKKIRSQLDSIGINGKFVYPDADNIAIYVQEHFK